MSVVGDSCSHTGINVNDVPVEAGPVCVKQVGYFDKLIEAMKIISNVRNDVNCSVAAVVSCSLTDAGKENNVVECYLGSKQDAVYRRSLIKKLIF